MLRELGTRIRKARADARRVQRERQLKLDFAFPVVREHLSTLPPRMRKGDLVRTDYREYLSKLNAGHEDRHNNDKLRAAVQAILKLFPAGRKNRGMSIADLDDLKARRAGLK